MKSYTSRVACNAQPQTWRQWIARRLRRAADRIDGRCTLALELSSTPAVPPEVHAECIRHGLAHMSRCLNNAAADECMEQVFREVMPHVFK